MTDKAGAIAAVAGILERAEHVHGAVTEKTAGRDDDWPLFYAWWLINWSNLPAELGMTPALAPLAIELARLDGAYRAGPRTEPWPAVYARELLAWAADQAR